MTEHRNNPYSLKTMNESSGSPPTPRLTPRHSNFTNYEFLSLIGKGSCGEVYKALYKKTAEL